MPSPYKDRFANAWEYLFMFSKEQKYYFDLEVVREYHEDPMKGSIKASYASAGPYWSIGSQPSRNNHFATFPEKLIERAIKTAPKQVCKKCGKPRERIIKRIILGKKQNRIQTISDRRRIAAFENRATTIRKTIGWTECNCDVGWKPGLICDPFMGTGTTGNVAQKLQRDFIGFERNMEYAQFANCGR